MTYYSCESDYMDERDTTFEDVLEMLNMIESMPMDVREAIKAQVRRNDEYLRLAEESRAQLEADIKYCVERYCAGIGVGDFHGRRVVPYRHMFESPPGRNELMQKIRERDRQHADLLKAQAEWDAVHKEPEIPHAVRDAVLARQGFACTCGVALNLEGGNLRFARKEWGAVTADKIYAACPSCQCKQVSINRKARKDAGLWQSSRKRP